MFAATQILRIRLPGSSAQTLKIACLFPRAVLRAHDNSRVFDKPHESSDEFNRQVDLRVLNLWQQGRWSEF